MIVDEKCSSHNKENFPQPIQMQLSEKPKMFCQFLTAFLKFMQNFEHYIKKDEPHSLIISEIFDSARFDYLNV